MKRGLFDPDEPVVAKDSHPVLLEVQSSLLERGRAAYVNGIRRVIWQAPCGSGKTVVAAEQTRRALALEKTILHIVHRRRLVDQMIRTLRKFEIAASPIMEGRLRWDSPVCCASRDTLLAMLKDGQGLPRFDLIIWDECHTAARALQEWYLTYHPNAWWTGYTATPVRPDGQSLNPPWQDMVCMCPTSELIRIGRLCPVKVYNPDAVGQRRRKGEKVKPLGDPIDHWKKYASGLPTVVFAATVTESQAICQRYLDAGITAEHLDALTPETERDEMFERSRTGETTVICNCGVLVEGVDLPWLTCCQILRGCNSIVLWIQATGRVMRFFAGKEFGIVLDHAGAAHEFGLPDSDFVWTLEDAQNNTKRNKPLKDRRPIACPSCQAVFVGKPACPECGKVLPKQRRKSIAGTITGDGLLTEFSSRQTEAITKDKLKRTWMRCLYMARANGWMMRRALGMFKSNTNLLPWEAGLDVPLPNGKDGWAVSAHEWMEIMREQSGRAGSDSGDPSSVLFPEACSY